MGKRAIRELLKQLLLLIISAQMDRKCCLRVLVAKAAKTFPLFFCGCPAPLLKEDRERTGKRWGPDGLLKGW